jgi:hypothetical protein
MSNRLAPAAIISIAQQAKPKVMGQILDCRAQLMACSTLVIKKFSSMRASIHGRFSTDSVEDPTEPDALAGAEPCPAAATFS